MAWREQIHQPLQLFTDTLTMLDSSSNTLGFLLERDDLEHDTKRALTVQLRATVLLRSLFRGRDTQRVKASWLRHYRQAFQEHSRDTRFRNFSEAARAQLTTNRVVREMLGINPHNKNTQDLAGFITNTQEGITGISFTQDLLIAAFTKVTEHPDLFLS